MGKQETFIRITGEPGVEESFPLKFLCWIGQSAEFSTPNTKSEEEKDGEQAAVIITQER